MYLLGQPPCKRRGIISALLHQFISVPVWKKVMKILRCNLCSNRGVTVPGPRRRLARSVGVFPFRLPHPSPASPRRPLTAIPTPACAPRQKAAAGHSPAGHPSPYKQQPQKQTLATLHRTKRTQHATKMQPAPENHTSVLGAGRSRRPYFNAHIIAHSKLRAAVTVSLPNDGERLPPAKRGIPRGLVRCGVTNQKQEAYHTSRKTPREEPLGRKRQFLREME